MRYSQRTVDAAIAALEICSHDPKMHLGLLVDGRAADLAAIAWASVPGAVGETLLQAARKLARGWRPS